MVIRQATITNFVCLMCIHTSTHDNFPPACEYYVLNQTKHSRVDLNMALLIQTCVAEIISVGWTDQFAVDCHQTS